MADKKIEKLVVNLKCVTGLDSIYMKGEEIKAGQKDFEHFCKNSELTEDESDEKAHFIVVYKEEKKAKAKAKPKRKPKKKEEPKKAEKEEPKKAEADKEDEAKAEEE